MKRLVLNLIKISRFWKLW